MTVKDSVLEALQASRDDFLSGESLSATLDVSRAAVWKAIKKLREEGYPIEAVCLPDTGTTRYIFMTPQIPPISGPSSSRLRTLPMAPSSWRVSRQQAAADWAGASSHRWRGYISA